MHNYMGFFKSVLLALAPRVLCVIQPRYLASLLCVCASFQAFDGTLKGKATDAGGEALPYATIYVEGTTQGVTTNGKGDYELSLAPGLYKLVCQYVGYKPA